MLSAMSKFWQLAIISQSKTTAGCVGYSRKFWLYEQYSSFFEL